MIIAIDFDGTCVTHEFPFVGLDIGAAKVIKRLVDSGHQIILWTMRSNVDDPKSEDENILSLGGKYLDDAVKWFEDNKIPLYGINSNPTQSTWTKSPKAYAQMYIDDAAFGVPLKFNSEIAHRPFVCWETVEQLLELQGYFDKAT